MALLMSIAFALPVFYICELHGSFFLVWLVWLVSLADGIGALRTSCEKSHRPRLQAHAGCLTPLVCPFSAYRVSCRGCMLREGAHVSCCGNSKV